MDGGSVPVPFVWVSRNNLSVYFDFLGYSNEADVLLSIFKQEDFIPF